MIVLAFVQNIQDLALGWQVLFVISLGFALLVAIGLLWPLAPWRKKRHQQRRSASGIKPDSTFPTIEFYDNRAALNRLRGDLQQELAGLRKGLASWTIFATSPSIDASNLRNVERMVLRHPDSTDLPELARRADIELDYAKTAIVQATKIALGQTVKVRWSKMRTPDLTIHNPDGNDAWIRVEPYIPGVPAGKKPSFIVRKSEREELFNDILSAYNDMWSLLEKDPEATPTQLTSDKEGSSPH